MSSVFSRFIGRRDIDDEIQTLVSRRLMGLEIRRML